jgi:NAD(P)-dependent dehydrogenase (short-subunit alcohol dehydrogenase family)
LKHSCAAIAEAGGGSFVAVSSHAGVLPFEYLASYCSSKAGLEGLVRVAANELGPKGVRVNAVRPGLVQRAAPSPILSNPQLLGQYLSRTPLGRTGVADDIASAIRFLVGPESSWMTGQCVTIDGGLELRGPPNLADLAGWVSRPQGGEPSSHPTRT